MNEIFKSTLSKCFLYTLLGIFVFSVNALIGMFIAGNTNLFEWHEIGRFVLVVISISITMLVVYINE
jgi:hypothetical protein